MDEAVESIGLPMIERRGTFISTPYDKPPSDERDPRGVFLLINGDFACAPKDGRRFFDEPVELRIQPEENDEVLFFFGYADNARGQEKIWESLSGADFEQNLQDTKDHWRNHIMECKSLIEEKGRVDYSKLSKDENEILEHNLIYLNQMMTGAGSWLASITNYWFSYTRDDGITAEYLSRLGLGKMYLPRLCKAYLGNYIEDKELGFRYWDTWYNNNHADSNPVHSQTDSVYYGIRAFYLCMKENETAEVLNRDSFSLITSALEYLKFRYYDPEKGLFKAVRVNESSVTDGETLTPTGRKIDYVLDAYYSVQGYACLVMVGEIAERMNENKTAERCRSEATEMFPRLRELLIDDRTGRVRYGMLHADDGYHPVDFGWFFPDSEESENYAGRDANGSNRDLLNDGSRYSGNRFEVAYAWALTVFPPEFCVFDEETRLKSIREFDAKRKFAKTFDQILMAHDPALREKKLEVFLRQACESRMVDAMFYDKDNDFKNCYLLEPYGMIELIDRGRKPQTFTIAPVLYYLLQGHRVEQE